MLLLVFAQFPSTGPLMRIGQSYAVLDCLTISFHIHFFPWLYSLCSFTHAFVILPQFPSCRASLTFRLMPHANAILDCSPILAAGHCIRQIYQPVPASQFMDDSCAEAHVVSSHLEEPLVSIRSKLHSYSSTHVIRIQSYSDTWELPQNSPIVGKGHTVKDWLFSEFSSLSTRILLLIFSQFRLQESQGNFVSDPSLRSVLSDPLS
jgi:hypothetical protein